MPTREDRAPVWAIWLLIAFGAVQPLAWWLGVGLPRHPVALIPLLVVWVTLLALAAHRDPPDHFSVAPSLAAGTGSQHRR